MPIGEFGLDIPAYSYTQIHRLIWTSGATSSFLGHGNTPRW